MAIYWWQSARRTSSTKRRMHVAVLDARRSSMPLDTSTPQGRVAQDRRRTRSRRQAAGQHKAFPAGRRDARPVECLATAACPPGAWLSNRKPAAPGYRARSAMADCRRPLAHRHGLQVRHAEAAAERVVLTRHGTAAGSGRTWRTISRTSSSRVVHEQRDRIDERRQRGAHRAGLLRLDPALAALARTRSRPHPRPVRWPGARRPARVMPQNLMRVRKKFGFMA